MANESVTLKAYHDAVKAVIQEVDPELQEVTYYAIKHDKIETSSVSIELVDWQPSEDDDGTGMQSWDFSWSAYVFVKFNSITAKFDLRVLAMKLCQAIEDNRFGIGASPAKVSICERDDFSPEWEAYEVFRIDWTQTARTGVDVWNDEVISPPEQILTSISPETGIPHEEHYLEVK